MVRCFHSAEDKIQQPTTNDVDPDYCAWDAESEGLPEVLPYEEMPGTLNEGRPKHRGVLANSLFVTFPVGRDIVCLFLDGLKYLGERHDLFFCRCLALFFTSRLSHLLG